MGGIPETGIEIDIGKGAIFTFYKFLRVFKTLVHNPLMRRATENSEEFPLESGQTPADTCGTHCQEVRPNFPCLPHHRHSPAAGVAGHLQHDGGRGTGSRNRATAAAYQQRRYFDVDKLCLYRHDTECEPVHRQAGRTESARCPNHHAGGNRQRERKHLQRSAKRCRADSQDAEQRCRI